MSTKNLPFPVHNGGNNSFEYYELKEFSSFVLSELQRFEYVFNFQEELADPLDNQGNPLQKIKPLYKSIKFFKLVENKLKNML
jgi:hypothetical protein